MRENGNLDYQDKEKPYGLNYNNVNVLVGKKQGSGLRQLAREEGET